MKLSNMNTIDGFEMMKKLLPATAKILGNAEIGNAKAILKGKESGAEIAAKITPILIQDHIEDVVQLVAVLQGSTEDEVKNQPIGETIETLSEGVKLFSSFFTASLHLVASA